MLLLKISYSILSGVNLDELVYLLRIKTLIKNDIVGVEMMLNGNYDSELEEKLFMKSRLKYNTWEDEKYIWKK